MRILQVLPAFNTGGVEEGTLAVSQALVEAGHGSYIASAGGHKTHEAKGAKHITLPLNKKSPFLLFKMINELSQIITEHKIDIIHARSRWPAWCAYFAAKRCGIHYMTTFHGCHQTNNFVKSFYNSIMVRASHTIAISNFMHDHIKTTYPLALQKFGTKLHMIPRGIDEDRFNPDRIDNKDVVALKQSWHVAPEHKLILFPARLTRLKGHHVFLDALPLLKSKNWTAILVGAQVGRDHYQAELQQKIKTLGLEDKVKILPAVDHMPLAYMAADVVVNPAIQPEAFGRVIIEAQAMGKPIIASDIGEPASLVENRVTGWTFESKNPEKLAEAIDKALNLTDKEKETLALKARESVLNNYTKSLMCKQTLKVYESIIGG